MPDRAEFIQVMTERQAMYRFLANVYRQEADRELLTGIGQMDLSSTTGVQEIDLGFQMLERFLNEMNANSLKDLSVDYACIFLGARVSQSGGGFPYESVYTSPGGLLMQVARDEVLEFYGEESIQLAGTFHDPEDHITFELEFMAHLCEKAAAAIETQDEPLAALYLDKQAAFLDKHLLRWIPRFCMDVRKLAFTDFYKGIAWITSGYLELEKNLLVDFRADLETLQ